MYDKIKLWIDRAVIGGHFPIIAPVLEDAKEQTDLATGETRTFGSVGGLKVSIYTGGISIIGSLPKFIYGNNVCPFDRHSTQRAIEKLSDIFHINITDADVTGIEFGTNFPMKHKVTDYLSKLGEMPRLSRYHFEPSTLYYKGRGKNTPKVFAFYDKLSEAEAKGMDYPSGVSGENLLRYEMRLTGRLKTQLGIADLQASTLYDRTFYRKLVKLYQNSYYSISKNVQLKDNAMSEIKTVSDAINTLMARLLSQTDKAQIVAFLDELRAAQVFNDSKYYTRLKNKINEIATKSDFVVTDELIRELDNDIKNCGAYV